MPCLPVLEHCIIGNLCVWWGPHLISAASLVGHVMQAQTTLLQQQPNGLLVQSSTLGSQIPAQASALHHQLSSQQIGTLQQQVHLTILTALVSQPQTAGHACSVDPLDGIAVSLPVLLVQQITQSQGQGLATGLVLHGSH